MDKTKCIGCEDDFYNDHNPYGIKECWSLKSATEVDRVRVGTWQSPPYDLKTVRVYSCRKEKGNVLVKPENLTAKGFWR